ncbi:MAG: GAF domain-containing protein, partial [Gemmatimonadota bacterium]|nr:GAF domain-containing protein [Gemmatimonadota bacterium]
MTKSGNPSSNRKKRNQLEVLFEISQEIQACTEEEDTYRSVLELMEELVDFESAALFVYDSRVDELKMAAGRGEMVDLIKPASFDMDQGLSAWVAKREKAVLLSEVHKGESPLKSPVRSFLSIPLHLGDKLAGVINFGHTRAGHFTREHLKVLSIAARSL